MDSEWKNMNNNTIWIIKYEYQIWIMKYEKWNFNDEIWIIKYE